MSRLDSAIRRLQAQRLCLNAAIAYVEELPGPFLELGLGNGRTYDHLREITPNRDIYVFERRPAAHPDSTPPAEFLIQGNFKETLEEVSSRIRPLAALAHCDIGSGDVDLTKALADFVGPALVSLLAPGAVDSNWPALHVVSAVHSRLVWVVGGTA